MPGSSRVPVSVRAGFNQARKQRPRNVWALLNVDLLRNIVFILFLIRWSRRLLWQLRGRGLFGSLGELYAYVRRTAYGYFLRAPGVRATVRRQVDAALAKTAAKMLPGADDATRLLALPAKGLPADEVETRLAKLADMDHVRWEDGMVSGAVYHGEKELLQVQAKAYERFTVANPIHPDVFPGVRRMEAEVIAMVLSLFNAPPGAAGLSTSGGTESILLACLSARQKAYVERGITEPEMILPSTAHTAFHKAASYFKIRARLVDCPPPNYQVDIQAAARLINPNTVLLVGSAPNFPHGIVDDISALSRLALRRNGGIPLHVDCCLGSFMMPFLEKVGFETTPFDFRVRGVTSISVDTHKYGFAPKGNSTLLFRTAALRSHAYFVSADWAGGVYASPGMAGSRPGALIAGCWATLVSVGEQGYADACREIVGAAKATAERIATSPVLCEELEIIGRPLCSVIAFKTRPLHHATSPSSSLNGSLSMDSAAKTPELVGGLNIYHIADAMVARGWHLNALQNPPGIHVAFTIPVARRWEALVADLEAVVAAERERKHALEAGEVVVSGAVGEEAEGLSNGPNRHGAETKTVTKKKAPKDESAQGDITALYGVAGSLPNKSVVVDLASGFLDLMLTA